MTGRSRGGGTGTPDPWSMRWYGRYASYGSSDIGDECTCRLPAVGSCRRIRRKPSKDVWTGGPIPTVLRNAVWTTAQFAVLSSLPGVDVDFTGLDDISAVEARNASPPQDKCLPRDDEDVLHDSASLWSSHRYTSALARRAGLGLVGKTPAQRTGHSLEERHDQTVFPISCEELRNMPRNAA